MKRTIRAATAGAAALAALAGAPAVGVAQAVGADVAEALDQVYQRFSAAYRDGDPAAVTALYAEDAYYLAPGRDLTRGEVGRHFDWLSAFEAGAGPVIDFEIVDRAVSGDLAYDIGYYRIRPAAAPDAEGSRGKFIVIWKRGEDAEWRIHADGFSDAPAAAGEGS